MMVVELVAGPLVGACAGAALGWLSAHLSGQRQVREDIIALRAETRTNGGSTIKDDLKALRAEMAGIREDGAVDRAQLAAHLEDVKERQEDAKVFQAEVRGTFKSMESALSALNATMNLVILQRPMQAPATAVVVQPPQQ